MIDHKDMVKTDSEDIHPIKQEDNSERENFDDNEKIDEHEQMGEDNSEVKNFGDNEKAGEEQRITSDTNIKNDSENIPKKVSLKERIKNKIVSFLDNKWNLAFLAVLLVALLIRFKYIGHESLWNDAAVHLWYAVKAVKEPLFFFSRQYLVEEYATVQTLTAIFYFFIRDILIAGKIVAILFGTAGIVFMYLLGSELKDKFFGLISAALLGFHFLFWFYGVRLLADAPLTSLIIITLYCLVKVEKEKTLFWGFLSAFMFLALMLTKKQSVLFFIAFLIYLIIFKRKEAIKNKALLVSGLIPVSAIVLGSLILGSALLISFRNMFFVTLAGFQDYGFQTTGFIVLIFSWYLLIPMIVGLIFVLIYKKKEYYLSLVFFLFYWFSFEIIIDNPQDRYILPLLPMGLLFASFGLIEISNYLVLFISKKKNSDNLKNGLVLLFIFLICWNFYNMGDQMIKVGSVGYIGYVEAGEWLKENVPDGTPIFVGSPRMMQAFVEREYGGPKLFEEGGSLWYLRAQEYLDNRTAFEEDLEILLKKSDVYLQIDVWEKAQPKWYYPITKDSLLYFENLGFKAVKIIKTETTIPNEQKKIIIGILKCDKRNSSETN